MFPRASPAPYGTESRLRATAYQVAVLHWPLLNVTPSNFSRFLSSCGACFRDRVTRVKTVTQDLLVELTDAGLRYFVNKHHLIGYPDPGHSGSEVLDDGVRCHLRAISRHHQRQGPFPPLLMRDGDHCRLL